jgi:hypothetical protein
MTGKNKKTLLKQAKALMADRSLADALSQTIE